MPLAQGVQDVNRFSYTFSELSLFCRIFAGFSVIFPYYLEINNIIYKIFGYVENRVASGPGGQDFCRPQALLKFTKGTQLPIINSASLRIERSTNGILIKP